MANYYTRHTAGRSLTCTEVEATKLKELLDRPDDPEDGRHGFDIVYSQGEAYIFAEESGDESSLPEPFLAYLGELLKQVGLPYLEFGFAHSCEKARPGSSGGGYYRVMADGTIAYPTLTWA